MCDLAGGRIAIILVNYRGGADTIDCLESIRSLKAPSGGFAVYIVDNASTDQSPAQLREWIRQGKEPQSSRSEECLADVEGAQGWLQVVFLQAATNRGFAAGCNLGLARAFRDSSISHFWLLNNDTVVDPAAAVELLACSRLRGDRSICGSTLLYYDDPQVVQAAAGAQYLSLIGRSRHAFKGKPLAEIVNEPSPSFDYVIGASMFFSRSVLETVGYLPEQYFLYAEETDWCNRARKLRISLDWAKGSLVFHKEGRSTGADARFRKLSDNSFYYVLRNNLIFLWRHSKRFLPTAIAYSFLEALTCSVKGNPRKLVIAFRACRDFWRTRNLEEMVRFPSRADLADNIVAGKSAD